MTASIILSNSEPKDKPEMSIRIDDDGDIWLKFSERGGELSVVLNQRQFIHDGECSESCCDFYKCPSCGLRFRVEVAQ